MLLGEAPHARLGERAVVRHFPLLRARGEGSVARGYALLVADPRDEAAAAARGVRASGTPGAPGGKLAMAVFRPTKEVTSLADLRVQVRRSVASVLGQSGRRWGAVEDGVVVDAALAALRRRPLAPSKPASSPVRAAGRGKGARQRPQQAEAEAEGQAAARSEGQATARSEAQAPEAQVSEQDCQRRGQAQQCEKQAGQQQQGSTHANERAEGEERAEERVEERAEERAKERAEERPEEQVLGESQVRTAEPVPTAATSQATHAKAAPPTRPWRPVAGQVGRIDSFIDAPDVETVAREREVAEMLRRRRVLIFKEELAAREAEHRNRVVLGYLARVAAREGGSQLAFSLTAASPSWRRDDIGHSPSEARHGRPTKALANKTAPPSAAQARRCEA